MWELSPKSLIGDASISERTLLVYEGELFPCNKVIDFSQEIKSLAWRFPNANLVEPQLSPLLTTAQLSSNLRKVISKYLLLKRWSTSSIKIVFTRLWVGLSWLTRVSTHVTILIEAPWAVRRRDLNSCMLTGPSSFITSKLEAQLNTIPSSIANENVTRTLRW